MRRGRTSNQGSLQDPQNSSPDLRKRAFSGSTLKYLECFEYLEYGFNGGIRGLPKSCPRAQLQGAAPAGRCAALSFRYCWRRRQGLGLGQPNQAHVHTNTYIYVYICVQKLHTYAYTHIQIYLFVYVCTYIYRMYYFRIDSCFT